MLQSYVHVFVPLEKNWIAYSERRLTMTCYDFLRSQAVTTTVTFHAMYFFQEQYPQNCYEQSNRRNTFGCRLRRNTQSRAIFDCQMDVISLTTRIYLSAPHLAAEHHMEVGLLAAVGGQWDVVGRGDDRPALRAAGLRALPHQQGTTGGSHQQCALAPGVSEQTRPQQLAACQQNTRAR